METNFTIKEILRETPYDYASIKCLEELTQPQLDRVRGIVERARRMNEVPSRCKDCEKLNKAMAMYRGFSWSGVSEWQMDFDEETKEILIPEEMLMHFIQLANPGQPERKIRLIKTEKAHE